MQTHQVAGKHPENAIPSAISKKLKLPLVKKNLPGIDGVLIDQADQLFTYQVKFRKSDYLPWGALKGAVAISTKAKATMIFTNALRISDTIKDHGGFALTKADLDLLSVQDISRIVELIHNNKETKRKIFKLRPYQKDAFNNVIDTFKTSNRTQLIMACGTGKTLIGQRLIEEINGKISLVLLPSLQLLEQTVDEFIKQTAWKALPAIFVGSDPSIPRGYDIVQMDQKDLKYKITTDSNDIKAFLKNDFKNCVIFSTYHSCDVVGKAMNGQKIDFAIFDEAHKTTGRSDTYAAYGLKDENINICKRLFMTATPKKYARKSLKDSDISVNVMGDSSIYGEVAHYLSFYRAAQLGIICKQKLIISVIDSQELDRSKLEKSQTVIQSEPVNSKYLAKNLALQDAIKKVKAKKIITFNTTIKQAKKLTDPGPLSIGNQLNEFELYHVSSKQNVKDRKSILNEFRDEDCSLVSNASCLTEGVDIPAVDLVAFMSPKKSRVDIAQAAGRSLRKPYGSNKEIGYLVVPIFIEMKEGETLEEAFEDTNFETVRSVVTAMMENDEVLEDEVKNIRRKKGVTGNYGGNTGLGEYIDVVGSALTIEVLEQAIKTRIIESTTNIFDENWGKGVHYLKNYINEKGNSLVPENTKIGNFNLGNWLKLRRDSLFKKIYRR